MRETRSFKSYHVILFYTYYYYSGELVRRCSPGDVIILSGVYLAIRYQGFKAIKVGLQTDVFLEAFQLDRQKLNFSTILMMDSDERKVQ
jgi:DNA replication licensing factor MCM7